MIPKRNLPHRTTYEPRIGNSAAGPVYGDAVTNVPARVIPQQAIVTDTNGKEVVSTAKIHYQPVSAPELGARVTLPSGAQRIVVARRDLSGRHTVELVTVDVA